MKKEPNKSNETKIDINRETERELREKKKKRRLPTTEEQNPARQKRPWHGNVRRFSERK